MMKQQAISTNNQAHDDQETTIPLSELKAIVSTVMYAAEADTLEQVLQRIAHSARELIGARYAALGVPDGRGGLLYFKVSGMSEDQIARMPHPPVGAGLLGAIMNEQQPLRLPRMRDDPRAVGFPEGHPDMTSLLGVPIQVGTQLFGTIYLTDREDGQPFSLRDQWMLETLAGYAALAIAGSQLREQGTRLTLLEERQRIGMELHDGVIQSLYALGMHIDLLRNDKHITPDKFQPVIDGLNTVIEDIRDYIMDLKAYHDTRRTVREMLRDVVSRLYVPDSIDVSVEAPERKPPFDPEDFESICLIAREAISNAMRHASASQVTIRAWQDHNNFQMVIRDDGRGFSPSNLPKQNGLGLRNIRERVRMHGGILAINSAPGQGTAITVTIPIERNRPDDTP